MVGMLDAVLPQLSSEGVHFGIKRYIGIFFYAEGVGASFLDTVMKITIIYCILFSRCQLIGSVLLLL